MAASKIFPQKTATDSILTCHLCLHPLENPFTLQQCLHTYCKGCLDEYPKESLYDTSGWNCPLCKTFSAEDEVKYNQFIEKLNTLEKARGEQKLQNVCKQCLCMQDVKWKCTDCKIELCTGCQTTHVKNIPLAKNHKIVSWDANDVEDVVDEFAFCCKHTGHQVVLNCKLCSVTMCLICKVKDHVLHESETVEDSLDRLLQELQQNAKTVMEKMEHFENKVKTIRNIMEHTKESYAQCRKKINTQFENVLKELKVIKDKEEQILAVKEAEALKRLEDIKLDLEAKVEEVKQLVNLCEVTTARAKNTSLLTEIQGGLFEKIKECSQVSSELMDFDVSLADFVSPSGMKKNEQGHNSVFGQISEHKMKCKISAEGVNLDDRYLCEDAVKYFKQSFVRTDEIDLQDFCYRISYINQHIWVPLEDGINIYDVSASLVKTLEFPFDPLVVKMIRETEILVGSNTGLFMLNQDKPSDSLKLADGSFSDLDTHGNFIHAYDSEAAQMRTFMLQPNAQSSCKGTVYPITQNSVFQIPSLDKCGTFCRTDKTILFASLTDKIVYEYDLTGSLTSQHPFQDQIILCGVDKQDCVVAANFQKEVIFVKNTHFKTVVRHVKLDKLTKPCDLVIDGNQNLWILEEKEREDKVTHQLVKYIPQSQH